MLPRVFLVLVALVALLLAQMPAGAAVQYVVGPVGNPYVDRFVQTGYAAYTTLDLAAQNAVANGVGEIVLVQAAHLDNLGKIVLDGAQTYPANINLTNGNALTIRGEPKGNPENVIVQSVVSGDPVVSLTGAGSSITLNDLTLTGGTYGLDVVNGTGFAERCYIRDNGDPTLNSNGGGVHCGANGAVTLTSCSISNNDGNGVSIDSTSDSSTILNCSIIENGLSGIINSKAATVSVTNTLVYRNARGGTNGSNWDFPVDQNDAGCSPDSNNAGWLREGQWQIGRPSKSNPLPFGSTGYDPDSGFTCNDVFGVGVGPNMLGYYTHAATVPVGLGPGTGGDITTSISTTFTMPASAIQTGVIGDLNLQLAIGQGATGCEIRQLTGYLTHTIPTTPPKSTTVKVFAFDPKPGNTDHVFSFTKLDDEALVPINDGIDPFTFAAAPAPLNDRFKPTEPLSKFDGMPIEGTWELTIEDSGKSSVFIDENFDGANFDGDPNTRIEKFWTAGALRNDWVVTPPVGPSPTPNNGYQPNPLNSLLHAPISYYQPVGATSLDARAWEKYEYSATATIVSIAPGIGETASFGFVFNRTMETPANYCELRFLKDGLDYYVGIFDAFSGKVLPSPELVLAGLTNDTTAANRGYLLPQIVGAEVFAPGAQITADIVMDSSNPSVTVSLPLLQTRLGIPAITAMLNASPFGYVGVHCEGLNTMVSFDNIKVINLKAPATNGVLLAWNLTISPRRYLTSPDNKFDFSTYSNVSLEYERWLSVDPLSGAFVEWLDNTGTIHPIWSSPTSANTPTAFADTEWVAQKFDLPEAAGQSNVRFRWGYYVDPLVDVVTHETPAAGWNIDDIIVKALRNSLAGVGGIVNVGTGAVTISHNDVLGHGATAGVSRDYIGIAAADITASNDISVEPQLRGNASWVGKLLIINPIIPHPLANKGVPGAGTDFEYELRSTTAPYIGADEGNGDANGFAWTDCMVTGLNGQPPPIGVLGASQLHVTITTLGTGVPTEVYVLPQGCTTKIVLQLEYATPGRYVYNNVTPIATTFTGAPPVGNDEIMDGEAVVHVISTGLDLPLTSSDGVKPAHFLIDTISPEADVDVVDDNALWNFSLLNPGPWGAQVATSPTHPYGGPPKDTTYAPQIYHVEFPPSHAPNSIGPLDPLVPPAFAGAFFNVGSFANEFVPENLLLRVQVKLRDPQVKDVFAVTDMQDRQVAGFLNSAVPYTGTPTEIIITRTHIASNTQLPVKWDVNNPGAAIETAQLALTPSASVGTSAFIDPSVADTIAEWSFMQGTVESGILPPSPDPGVGFNLMGKVLAYDRAGNESVDRLTALKPYNIKKLGLWWYRDVQMLAVTKADDNPYWRVSWTAPNTGIPAEYNPPAPWYTFRVFASDTQEGPYDQIPGSDWQAWSMSNVIDYQFFQPFLNANNLEGKYLLITTAVCDQAGNVSLWPFWPYYTDAGGIMVSGESGAGWVTVQVGGSRPCDTSMYPDLFYRNIAARTVTADLGPATSVVYPAVADEIALNLALTLHLGALSDAEAQKDRYRYSIVHVIIEEDGMLVFEADVMANMDAYGYFTPEATRWLTVPLDPNRLPDNVAILTNTLEEIGHRGNPTAAVADPPRIVKYVVRAYTIEYADSARSFEVSRDTTEANFSFMCVPTSVPEYLNSIGGEQPIKSFETK